MRELADDPELVAWLDTNGMTVEESKKIFIEKAFQSEGNAEQQSNRGTFDPAYLNYTMGKPMIRK